MENIKAVEQELKTETVADLRKKEIISFLALKIGVSVYRKYFYSRFSSIENGDIGNGWEIEKKIEKILDTYIERKPDASLSSYMYISLKRYVFKEFILKSHAYIKTEKGILKCPVCRYDEYLELVNPYLRIYKCSHCEDIVNSEMVKRGTDDFYKHKTFSFFTEDGVECVGCKKNIPISSLNIKESWIDTDWAQLIFNGIEEEILPDELIMADLKCPYCFDIFKLKDSKQKSLATSKRYRKFSHVPISNNVILNGNMAISPFKNIDAIKKSNILIEELVIKLAHLESNSFNKCLKKYLYLSQIYWIKKYWNYAADYFYNKADILGIDIHKTMFDMWLSLISMNFNELKQFKNINNLEDLKWFCREPNFSNGPIDTFVTEVTENNRIKNNTNIVDLKSAKWNIRMAKILEINKIQNEESFSINLEESSLTITWQDIILSQEKEINPGDIVSVRAMMMPGHPSHAPIRALLRVRSDVLSNIISRVRDEENSRRDIDFWKFRETRVKTARNNTKIDTKV